MNGMQGSIMTTTTRRTVEAATATIPLSTRKIGSLVDRCRMEETFSRSIPSRRPQHHHHCDGHGFEHNNDNDNSSYYDGDSIKTAITTASSSMPDASVSEYRPGHHHGHELNRHCHCLHRRRQDRELSAVSSRRMICRRHKRTTRRSIQEQWISSWTACSLINNVILFLIVASSTTMPLTGDTSVAEALTPPIMQQQLQRMELKPIPSSSSTILFVGAGNNSNNRRGRKSSDPAFMYEDDDRFIVTSDPSSSTSGSVSSSNESQQKNRQRQHKKRSKNSLESERSSNRGNSQIEVVSFRRSSSSSSNKDSSNTQDGSEPAIDPRVIPCVPTLDLYDGALPASAYIMDGQSENDPKITCRIGIAVNYDDADGSDSRGRLSNRHTTTTSSGAKKQIDVQSIVDRLHDCIDSGFNTFQLRPSSSSSSSAQNNDGGDGLQIINQLKQQTPSWVETHWALTLDISSYLQSGSRISMSDIRQDVVELIRRSGSDAIDSLQVSMSDYDAQQSSSGSPYTVDVFDYLVELQREGLIRSIAARNCDPSVVRRIRKELGSVSTSSSTSTRKVIDYQQYDGNLILPTPRSLLETKSTRSRDDRLWISDPLASGLLSETYNTNPQWKMKHNFPGGGGGSRNGFGRRHQNRQTVLLRDWASKRRSSTSSRGVVESEGDDNDDNSRGSNDQNDGAVAYRLLQTQVLDRLSWIALKHQVSMETVAIRWCLECGGGGGDGGKNGQGSIVSSTVVDCIFDGSQDDDPIIGGRQRFQAPIDLRRVFTFELDDEDKELLQRCSAYWLSPKAKKQQQEQMSEYFSVLEEQGNDNLFLSGRDREEMSRLEREMNVYNHNRGDDYYGNGSSSSGGGHGYDNDDDDDDDEYPEIDFSNSALWL